MLVKKNKWEKLAATTKSWKWAAVEKKVERSISSIKRVTGKFLEVSHRAWSSKTRVKKCTTKCAARAKFFFANRAYSATKSGWVNYKYIDESFAWLNLHIYILNIRNPFFLSAGQLWLRVLWFRLEMFDLVFPKDRDQTAHKHFIVSVANAFFSVAYNRPLSSSS